MSELHREYSRGEGDPRWYGLAGHVALDLWDQHAWDDLTARQLTALRAGGLLTLLPGTLAFRIATCVHAGRFSEAQALLEEAHAIAGATGTPPPGYIEPLLAAYRGDEARTLELVRAGLDHAAVRAEEPLVMIVHFAAAVLHNSLGQYSDALAATDLAIQYDQLDMYGYALAQRIEAAARLGETDIAAEALQQLVERAEASGTDLALGVAARSRALLAEGAEADALYREAITLLRRSRVNVLLARAQLIYGEWLRSENRRDDAREQLRRAYEVFTRVGANGFAERTRLELLALGESVGKTTPSLSDALTNQELFIARLARDGHTNQEIAAQLFISRRTVEWHLSKVFHKLDIKSRRGLRAALAQID
jgi:DNA-binding CsgD family transcriptional regulator